MKYILMNGLAIVVVLVAPDSLYNELESELNRNLEARSDHQWVDGTGNDWQLKRVPEARMCAVQVVYSPN